MTSVHEPVELAFTGPPEPIPATRTPFTVTVRSGGRTVRVPGFWDGDRRYVARFLPDRAGEWTWRTASAAAELAGHTGAVTVSEGGAHGPVRVAARFHFAHADGTPHRPVGTTAYNWLHQDDDVRRETADDIARAGFNRLRFLVFPQTGGYVTHDPVLLPFERDAGGRWDVARPVPAFFARLDAAVRMLGERGIQADVLILNAYDDGRFGLGDLTEEEDAAYARYLVARLSAFPNVWWSLCNEHDILGRPADRWDRLGRLVAESDPYDHLRSIHNLTELFDHNRPWVTHASIQNGHAAAEPGRAVLYRDAYGKPVVLDEIKYEGDIALRWGHLSGAELVHRFWIATVSGCYASHGESFERSDGSLHMVAGGRLQGSSPVRLRFLRGILEGLEVAGVDPIDKWDDPETAAGVPGRVYLRYFGRSAPERWSFRLPQATASVDRLATGDTFTVDVIDTWNMTVTPVGRPFVLDDVRRNEAFARAAEAVALPAGGAIALRITRAHKAAGD
ncbi:MAG: DUF4038 domain-containing protein [Microbacterium arborescens]